MRGSRLLDPRLLLRFRCCDFFPGWRSPKACDALAAHQAEDVAVRGEFDIVVTRCIGFQGEQLLVPCRVIKFERFLSTAPSRKAAAIGRECYRINPLPEPAQCSYLAHRLDRPHLADAE